MWLWPWVVASWAGTADLEQAVARGEVLAGLGGCSSCHTTDGGPPYGGGEPIETRWGTFTGSNLTPDPTHGLGGWSFEDFERAMRHGVGPGGERYWPAFPYPWFGSVTDDDLQDLWWYLQSVEPVETPDAAQQPRKAYGGLLGLWRLVAFRAARPEPVPDPARSEAWNRGAYLVRGVGHCGGCHTPRTSLGRSKARRELAGTDSSRVPEASPNLTPHADGLQGWSSDDVVTFLELAMTPDGDFVGGAMGHLIEAGTARLELSDREAIATYLLELPPRASR